MQRFTVSRLRTAVLGFVCALAIVACAGVPMGTFNDKVAAGERTILLVQTSATAALRAQQITLEQDQLVQKQVELLHTGLVMAKSLQSSKPEAAAAQLASVLAQLEALKTQTGANTP